MNFIGLFFILGLLSLIISMFVLGAKESKKIPDKDAPPELVYAFQQMITDSSSWPPNVENTKEYRTLVKEILEQNPHIPKYLSSDSTLNVPDPSTGPLYFEYFDPITNSTIRYVKSEKEQDDKATKKTALFFIIGVFLMFPLFIIVGFSFT